MTEDKFPTRKDLRLKNYDYAQSGAYFVTICTQNRVPYFAASNVGADRCVRPYDMIAYWINEIPNHFKHTHVDISVVMPDHVHFILRIDRPHDQGGHAGPPLQKMIQWFKTMTTNEYTKAVKAGILPPYDRRIWQRAYYEHVIRNDSDFRECWKYIQENPMK